MNPISQEALACTLAFIKLGFSPNQVGAGIDGTNQAFVTLHHGGEQFNIQLGNVIDLSHDKFVGAWREAMLSIQANSIDKIKLEELCQRSVAWSKMQTIVAQLVKRKFLNV